MSSVNDGSQIDFVVDADDIYLQIKRRSTSGSEASDASSARVQRDSIYDVSATADWTPPRTPTEPGCAALPGSTQSAHVEFDGFPWWAGAMSRDDADLAMCEKSTGSFVVRLSTRPGSAKQALGSLEQGDCAAPERYAITVAIDPTRRQTLNIAVLHTVDGKWEVDGEKYESMQVVLAELAANPYRGIAAALLNAATALAPRLPPPRPGSITRSPASTPPGSPRPRRSDFATPPPVPPRTSASPLSKLDFESDAIYLAPVATKLSSEGPYDRPDALENAESPYDRPSADEEETYSTAKFSTLPRRANTSLPSAVSDWSAGDVQRWCHENGLESFCKPLYSNGVTGQELLMIKGDMFPAKRFSKSIRRAFDAALKAAVSRAAADTPSKGSLAPVPRKQCLVPPPVPARANVSG